MAVETSSSDYRYWAFISYSSRDRAWARWLHHAIETYGIPAQLVSHPTPIGHPAPKRFQPLFRDRDELPASADLSMQIDAALRVSNRLIERDCLIDAHLHFLFASSRKSDRQVFSSSEPSRLPRHMGTPGIELPAFVRPSSPVRLRM